MSSAGAARLRGRSLPAGHPGCLVLTHLANRIVRMRKPTQLREVLGGAVKRPKLSGYLHRNAGRVKYAKQLAEGRAIGSGQAEGARN